MPTSILLSSFGLLILVAGFAPFSSGGAVGFDSVPPSAHAHHHAPQEVLSANGRTHGAHGAPGGRAPADPHFTIDREAGTIHLVASLQREAFEGSTAPDQHYHALVSRTGGAAGKALFVTDASDADIASALRTLGALDGGGVPLRAWSLRNLPFAPQPRSHVKGSAIDIFIAWEGSARGYSLEELLDEIGDRGIEMRFGGNEEHDEHWDSGCIVCLFSCPGGVVSNALYSIRDHVKEVTRFGTGDRLPPDGTEVTITLQLRSG